MGTVVRLAAGIQPHQLAQVMKGNGSPEHEPVLVAEWVPDAVPDGERQTRWQQLWQCLNLLLPLRAAWAGAADMPGLEALQNAPVLQAQPSGLPAAWVEVLGLVQRDLHAWATALAELGLQAPVVGYELLDEKGRIVAEAEMAWEAQLGRACCPTPAPKPSSGGRLDLLCGGRGRTARRTERTN
jgi:DEAD/DEAH box helicase domain-containing protein